MSLEHLLLSWYPTNPESTLNPEAYTLIRLLLQRVGGCECAAVLAADGVPSLAEPTRAPEVTRAPEP